MQIKKLRKKTQERKGLKQMGEAANGWGMEKMSGVGRGNQDQIE